VRMPNYGNRDLLSERSDPKIDGAERSGERAMQKNDGAGGRGAGTEVTGLGWSVERLFRPLRSAHMLWLIPVFYADKIMVMGNSKNLCVFNFAILHKLRKFDAREIYLFYSTLIYRCVL